MLGGIEHLERLKKISQMPLPVIKQQLYELASIILSQPLEKVMVHAEEKHMNKAMNSLGEFVSSQSFKKPSNKNLLQVSTTLSLNMVIHSHNIGFLFHSFGQEAIRASPRPSQFCGQEFAHKPAIQQSPQPYLTIVSSHCLTELFASVCLFSN
jgi:hypothetical protein